MIRTKWFSVDTKGDNAELDIFDEIGSWGVTVPDFKSAFDLVKDKKRITLKLNSPGGSVFDGLALYHILSSVREKLTIEVIGLAASSASIIFLAGSNRIMYKGTFLMIHNPWAITAGDAAEMQKVADTLGKIKNEMVTIYETYCNKKPKEIITMMDNETWLTADDAQSIGFATSIKEGARMAALFDFKKLGYKNAPQEFEEKKNFNCQTIREYEAFLRDAGASRNQAAALAANGWKGCHRDDDSIGKAALVQAIDKLAEVLQ